MIGLLVTEKRWRTPPPARAVIASLLTSSGDERNAMALMHVLL